MKIGTVVAGKYHGRKFSGVVVAARPITVKPADNCVEHIVRLDCPFELYGTGRDEVMVVTREDGTPSTYYDSGDWMREINN